MERKLSKSLGFLEMESCGCGNEGKLKMWNFMIVLYYNVYLVLTGGSHAYLYLGFPALLVCSLHAYLCLWRLTFESHLYKIWNFFFLLIIAILSAVLLWLIFAFLYFYYYLLISIIIIISYTMPLFCFPLYRINAVLVNVSIFECSMILSNTLQCFILVASFFFCCSHSASWLMSLIQFWDEKDIEKFIL